MSWGANAWLKITKEQDATAHSTYGVYSLKATPIEGTDFIWIRIDQNNGFSMRPIPAYYTIRSADGGNRRVQTGTSRYANSGTLRTLLYPTQAQFLLDMALNLAQLDLTNDLLSYTCEFFDTQKTYRLLGCKVDKLNVKCDATSQIAVATFDLMGSQSFASPPALAAPTSANFPTIVPYVHQDSAGVVKINNLVRVKSSSIDLTVDNKLGATFDELPYITQCFYAGRNVDFVLKSQYAALADRAALEAGTAQITTQLKWVKGANSVLLDLKSTNFITKVDDDLPLDNAAYQTLSVASLYDRTASTDASVTVV